MDLYATGGIFLITTLLILQYTNTLVVWKISQKYIVNGLLSLCSNCIVRLLL